MRMPCPSWASFWPGPVGPTKGSPRPNARALNPLQPSVGGFLGAVYFMSSRHEEAVELLLEDFQRNPNNPVRVMITVTLAFAQYVLGHYESALSWADRTLRLMPGFLQADTVRAAALAQLGRAEEAKGSLERFLAHFPDATCTRHLRNFRWRNPDDVEHFKDGLRKAGLPE